MPLKDGKIIRDEQTMHTHHPMSERSVDGLCSRRSVRVQHRERVRDLPVSAVCLPCRDVHRCKSDLRFILSVFHRQFVPEEDFGAIGVDHREEDVRGESIRKNIRDDMLALQRSNDR